jgi:hypothetical protein
MAEITQASFVQGDQLDAGIQQKTSEVKTTDGILPTPVKADL